MNRLRRGDMYQGDTTPQKHRAAWSVIGLRWLLLLPSAAVALGALYWAIW